MTIITDTKTIARFNELRAHWGDKAYKGYASAKTAAKKAAPVQDFAQRNGLSIQLIKIDSGIHEGRLVPACVVSNRIQQGNQDGQDALWAASFLCRQGILCI